MNTTKPELPEPVAKVLAEMRNDTNQTWLGKRVRWADEIEACFAAAVAVAPNLSDPAVQKRLAAQWGFVPAETRAVLANAMRELIKDVFVEGCCAISTYNDEPNETVDEVWLKSDAKKVYDVIAVPSPAEARADAAKGPSEAVKVLQHAFVLLIEIRRTMQAALDATHPNDAQMLLVNKARLNAAQDCIDALIAMPAATLSPAPRTHYLPDPPAEQPKPAVREALLLAHETFLRYAKLHRDKGTPDGDEKAAANQALGERMYAALSEQPAPIHNSCVGVSTLLNHSPGFTQPARVTLSDEQIHEIAKRVYGMMDWTHIDTMFARAVIAEYERINGIALAQGELP